MASVYRNIFHSSLLLLTCTFILSSCQGQFESPINKNLLGGPCEGCEALFEYGDKNLHSTDTLPGFASHSPQIIIKGTIYKSDRKTPASGVIVYLHHTNTQGIYETKGNEQGWAKRHGIYRGWIKTDSDGSYAIHTFRPASYPGTHLPQHIHLTVKEPNKPPYYIDDILFDDDPFLTESHRKSLQNRCGSGIVSLNTIDGIGHGKRDIILGLHIPNYY